MHCPMELHVMETLIHCPVEPHALANSFFFWPVEPHALETLMHFPVEPHALANHFILFCFVEPYALATHALPYRASCSKNSHALPCGASCSGKPSYIALWSFMLWKPPSCRSWSLDLGKNLHFWIDHTIYWLMPHVLVQIQLLYGFKQYNLWSKQYFHHTQTTHFSFPNSFLIAPFLL